MFRTSDESVYDVGSIPSVPHMLLSSRRHFRDAPLEGSRPSRAYASISEEQGRAITTTYLVQIINEPYQVVALKVCHPLLILLSVKYITELVVKVG
jgi:hypothetical protein